MHGRRLGRRGLDPTTPEVQIDAYSLVGLWRIQFQYERGAQDSDLVDPGSRQWVPIP